MTEPDSMFSLDTSDLLVKLHLAAAKFTQDTDKACVVINTAMSKQVKSPDPLKAIKGLLFKTKDPDQQVVIFKRFDKLANSKFEVQNAAKKDAELANINVNTVLASCESGKDDPEESKKPKYAEVKKIVQKCYDTNKKTTEDAIYKLMQTYLEVFLGKDKAKMVKPTSMVLVNPMTYKDQLKDFPNVIPAEELKESLNLFSGRLVEATNKPAQQNQQNQQAQSKPQTGSTTNSANQNQNKQDNQNQAKAAETKEPAKIARTIGYAIKYSVEVEEG